MVRSSVMINFTFQSFIFFNGLFQGVLNMWYPQEKICKQLLRISKISYSLHDAHWVMSVLAALLLLHLVQSLLVVDCQLINFNTPPPKFWLLEVIPVKYQKSW